MAKLLHKKVFAIDLMIDLIPTNQLIIALNGINGMSLLTMCLVPFRCAVKPNTKEKPANEIKAE